VLSSSPRSSSQVKFYKGFDSHTKFYLTFELVTGSDLFNCVLARGRFTEHNVAAIIHSVLGALDYLHHHGIVHRDLKCTFSLSKYWIVMGGSTNSKSMFKAADRLAGAHLCVVASSLVLNLLMDPSATMQNTTPMKLRLKCMSHLHLILLCSILPLSVQAMSHVHAVGAFLD